MNAREFHKSYVDELTVTIVTKTLTAEGFARILGHSQFELIHAFAHDSRDIPYNIIKEASRKLALC